MKKGLLKIGVCIILFTCLIGIQRSLGQTWQFAYLSGGLTATPYTNGNSKVAIAGFQIQVSGGSKTFKQFNIQSDFGNVRNIFANGTLYRSPTNSFNSGTPGQPIGNVTFSNTNGNVTIDGFSETITSTTNYYFLVVDIIGTTGGTNFYINTGNFAVDDSNNNNYPFYNNNSSGNNTNTYRYLVINSGTAYPLTIVNNTTGVAASSLALTPSYTDAVLYSISVTNNSASSYTISNLNINSNIATLSNYFTSLRLVTNTTNTYPGTGTTYAGTANASYANFSGLSLTIAAGNTRHFWLVANRTAGSNGGVSVQFNIMSGQSTNSLAASTPSANYNTATAFGNTYNLVTADIALTNSGISGLSSTTIYPLQTDVAVFGFGIRAVSGSSTVSAFSINSDNSSLSTYYGNPKLYYSSSATFNSSSPGTPIGTALISGSSVNITGLSESLITSNKYYFLVLDVIYSSTGTNSTTFRFDSSQPTAAVTQSGPSAGSYNNFNVNGSTYNITQASPSITISGNNSYTNGITSGALSYGQTGIVFFSFKASVIGSMTVQQFFIPTSIDPGPYFTSGKLYRSNTPYFANAGPVTGSVDFNIGGGMRVTGMSQVFNAPNPSSPTVYYYFIVGDFTASTSFSAPTSIKFNFVNGTTYAQAQAPGYTTYNNAVTTDGISLPIGNTYRWYGGSNFNDFNTAANWRTLNNSNASVPTATDIVEIGTAAYGFGGSNPVVSSNTTVGGIIFGNTVATSGIVLNSGVTLTLNKQLSIKDNYTPAITVSSGTANLNMGPLSTISFPSTTTGVLSIPAALTITLKSDASGTAAVGQIGTNSISGAGASNIVAERFMPGGAATSRGYRLLSSPVYSTTSVSPLTPTGLRSYNLTQLRTTTIITGPGTGGTANLGTRNSNGFDVSTNNNPSVFVYRESETSPSTRNITTSDYKGFASTNEYVPIGNGILYFFRGNRTITQTGNNSGSVFTSPYPYPTSTTLSHIGTIPVGPVSVYIPQFNSGALSYYNVLNTATGASANRTVSSFSTALSYTNNSLPGTDGFNLVGNPFPSTIDLEAVTLGAGISGTIYVLNSNTQTFGTYVRSGSTSTDGVALNGASRYVLSGQGFFVKALSSGSTSNRTVTFPESAKTTYPSGSLSSTGNPSATPTVFSLKVPVASIRLKLIQDSVFYNETLLTFSDNNKDEYNDEDVPYLTGPGQTIFMYSNAKEGQACTVNKMAALENVKSVPLYVEGGITGIYKLEFAGMNSVASRYRIYLKDAFTKDSLDITANSTYSFNITRGNTATYGANRFSLVVHKDTEGNYKLTSFKGIKDTKNTAKLNWQTVNESDVYTFELERSTDGGKTFTSIGIVQANTSGTYSLTDATPIIGINTYRLKQSDVADKVTYSDLVTLDFSVPIAPVSESAKLYPNPTDSKINIDLPEAAVNQVEIRIVNMSGRLFKSEKFNPAQHFEMMVNELQSGIYVADVYDKVTGENLASLKFLKN